MNQTEWREQIRTQIERILPGPLSDVEIERIAAVAPAFYALVSARALGVLPGGRRATDACLRRANKPLLNYLAASALSLFRGAGQGLPALDAAPDLCGVAAFLQVEESDDEDFDLGPLHERIYETARRFAHLVLIETTRRVWLDHYPMLARATDDVPSHFPVAGWLTRH